MSLGPGDSLGAVRVLVETLRPRPRIPEERLAAAWRTLRPAPLQGLIRLERCTLWLYRRIRALGIEPAVPPELFGPLREQATQLAARNLLVDAQALELSRWLKARGTPHFFLKGIALRASAAQLPYADARSTTDVDVLVPEELAQELWETMQREGYSVVRDPSGNRTVHHLFPLWNANKISVEIHTSISPPIAARDIWERTRAHGHDVSWQAASIPVPSATDLLWHSVSHAVRDGALAWHLRYFQDPAVILASGVPIEWDEVAKRLAVGAPAERERAARWLGTASWLAGVALPEPIASKAPPCDLLGLLAWRHWVLSHSTGRPRVQETLLEEASRAEGRLLVRSLRELDPARRSRRVASAIAGQAAYGLWRVARALGGGRS
jgi:hypothetical protein